MATPFTPLLIDGQLRPASSGKSYEVRNSYSGQVVGTAASATSQDCKDAIEAAGRAFQTWEKSTLAQRRDIFLKAADLLVSDKYKTKNLEAIKDEISAVDPIVQSISLEFSASTLKTAAGLVHKLKGDTVPSVLPGAYAIGQRRAKGVM